MQEKSSGAMAAVTTMVAASLLMAGVVAWSSFDAPGHAAPRAVAGPDLAPALQTGMPTVVEFGANACASCREMKVVLGRVRQMHDDRYRVVEIDLFKQQETGRRHGIQLMPTQVFFDARGHETGRHMGSLALEQVVSRLEQAAVGSQ